MIEYAKNIAIKLQVKNVNFQESENLLSISPKSQDLLILNNVFNILINKEEIISESREILKIDGLLVVADEFVIDDLPESLLKDPQFLCGGIASAKRMSELINLMNRNGFKSIREEIIRSYSIKYNGRYYRLISGIVIFSVNSLRLFFDNS